MAEIPLASRSSTIRLCSAAVPSEGIRNSTSTPASSLSACSQPRRAMVQTSAALLVTKARFLVEDCCIFEHAVPMKPTARQQPASITRKNLIDLSFLVRRVGYGTISLAKLLHG